MDIFKILIIILVFFCFNLNLEKSVVWGDNNYKKNNKQQLDENIFFKLIEDADSGNIEAQGLLGKLYCIGWGVEKNVLKGLAYLLKAANSGDKSSEAFLNAIFMKGKIEKKAIQGDVNAQFFLGKMYYYGLGIEADEKEAFKWFHKAAINDSPDAQLFLGRLYNTGQGVEKDYQKAAEWLQKAIGQGSHDAESTLVSMYCNDELIPENYKIVTQMVLKSLGSMYGHIQVTILQPYDNKQKSHLIDHGQLEKIKKSAKRGEPLAQFMLAMLYHNGIGVKKDHQKAIELFTKSAQQHNDDALAALSFIYSYGIGVQQNDKTAFECIKKAYNISSINYLLCLSFIEKNGMKIPSNSEMILKSAKDGNIEAQTALGAHYYISGDDKKAVEWLSKASEKNQPIAQFFLSDSYDEGRGVKKDIKKSIELLKKSAQQNFAPSQYFLGKAFCLGKGVPQDYRLALKWTQKAADQGFEPAIKTLSKSK